MATPAQRKKTLVINAPASRPSVTVKLVGKPYEVHKPKSTLALTLAEFDSNSVNDRESAIELKERLYSLIDSLFGRKADEVKARLNDSADSLDIEHVMDTVKKVSEYFGKENPTT